MAGNGSVESALELCLHHQIPGPVAAGLNVTSKESPLTGGESCWRGDSGEHKFVAVDARRKRGYRLANLHDDAPFECLLFA